MSFGSSVGMQWKCLAVGQGSNTEGNPLLFIRGLAGLDILLLLRTEIFIFALPRRERHKRRLQMVYEY